MLCYACPANPFKPPHECADDTTMTVATPSATNSETEKRERDRRRSARTPQICEAWLSSPTATDPSDRVEVTTLNMSRHGVAFEIPVAIPTGAFYLLRCGVGNQKITTEIRILSCRHGDESFQIGAEFC